MNTITGVKHNSPAYRAGIQKGMELIAIDGHKIKDIFDLHFYADEGNIVLTLREGDKETDITVLKAIDEELGLEFSDALLDGYHSCTNKCIFCFIDQMPPGMRDTLYFKDDDTRLSFLQGNYVTLTNVKEEELNRIIKYRLAPINISIHATDPDVRRMMLGNRFAGEVLDKIQRIYDASLPMNGQIVLCKGINDGKVLEKSVDDLWRFQSCMTSVSVVPVGLTKYRDNLYPLEAYNEKDAKKILAFLEKKNREYRRISGRGFVYPSDEWYLLAHRGIPKDEYYDGYPQLENGVGMIRLLIEEFREAMAKTPPRIFIKPKSPVVVSGILAAPIIYKLCEIASKKYRGLSPVVVPIENDFFGRSVTVSGLVTGQDIIKQLMNKVSGKRLLIPINMLRYHERVFLDDVSIEDVEKSLHCKITIVESNGKNLLKALLN